MPTTREPLYECQECGKKFYTEKAAERASFGDRGCPGCGGSDIDIYVGRKGKSVGRFGEKGHKGTSSPHSREDITYANFEKKYNPVGTGVGKWLKYKKHVKDLKGTVTTKKGKVKK
jgi:hypothetical protein